VLLGRNVLNCIAKAYLERPRERAFAAAGVKLLRTAL
jgi:hypothetical protein